MFFRSASHRPRPNMSDQLPPANDDGIQWTKATSKNGVPFEFGTKKTEHPIDGQNAGEERQALAAASDQRISVHWPVGDDTWKGTGTGELYNIISMITAGLHGVDVYFEGDHYVRYNSKKPTIRTVGLGYAER